MTDELDPQTQQHIDDSADVAADTDAATCNDTDVDDATLDNGAAKMQASKTTIRPLRTTPPKRTPSHKQKAPSRCLRKKSSMPSWTP